MAEEKSELETAIDLARELLNTTMGTLMLATAVLIFIVFKLLDLPIFQSYLGRREMRAKTLEEYLASGLHDPSTKIVATELRSALVFQIATGIYAEDKWRKGLVKLHKTADTTWIKMKRAWPYMEIKPDGTVFIRRFGFWDYFEWFFNTLLTMLFLFFGAAVIIIAIKYAAGPGVVVAALATGIACFMAGMWFLSQIIPMANAKQITQ